MLQVKALIDSTAFVDYYLACEVIDQFFSCLWRMKKMKEKISKKMERYSMLCSLGNNLLLLVSILNEMTALHVGF